MGLYLTPGHTYSDVSPNNAVNGTNLNELVSEAVLKPTTISGQTIKDPAALSDEVLVNDGGSLKKETWQQIYALFIEAGTVIQTSYVEYTANTNLTTVIPIDDTIPQNTEGTEILSVSITPRFATSKILARFQGQYSNTAAPSNGVAALFRDAITDALAAQLSTIGVASYQINLALEYMDSPATTSAITYSIRVGPSSGIMRLNGNTTDRYLGGASRATLVLQEIKV